MKTSGLTRLTRSYSSAMLRLETPGAESALRAGRGCLGSKVEVSARARWLLQLSCQQ